MNVNASYRGSRKREAISANGRKPSGSVGDRVGVGGYSSPRDFDYESCRRNTTRRLIDASCNAFFLRRGLDPNLDWHSLFGDR